MDREIIKSVFQGLVVNPTPLGARLRLQGSTLEVLSQWEQRDLQRSEKVIFQKSHVLFESDLKQLYETSPVELHNEQLRAFTTDGNHFAVLRKVQKQGVDKQYIEIWKDNFKVKNIDVCAQEKHLQILADVQFGCLEWSPSGTHLAYVAEKYFKAESYFKNDSKAKKTESQNANIMKGEEFLYRQSWGESLQSVHHPIVFTVDVETGDVREAPGVADFISAGHAVWTPDGKGVVFVGWWHDPVRLGLIYCGNRRSAVFHSDFESRKTKMVGESDGAVDYPKFSPDGKTLIFLRSLVGGPHRNVQALMKCDWETKTVTTVVDFVKNPFGDQFPGIYVLSLPNRVWHDDRQVLFHSIWRSKQELLSVDIITGQVNALTNDTDTKIGNWELLDCYTDLIVATVSSPSVKPHLVIGRMVEEGSIEWKKLGSDVEKEADISWVVMQLKPPADAVNPTYARLDYEAILTVPATNEEGKLFPLIVFPHGGPHMTMTAQYYLSVDFFSSLGFAVLIVNYRGSLGFGQDSINSLLGNIGTQDTKDVQFAVETALKSGKFDRNNVVLFGGSHGGFLVISLSGLHPDFYKACVARNPVVDVSGMTGVTDIPDWNFVENGGAYQATSLAGPTELKSMWEKSPIRLVDKIKIPVLLMLGNLDLRVPHHQGLMLYNALKVRGIDTRAYLYNDNHALSKVESESDSLIHAADWMLKYVL